MPTSVKSARNRVDVSTKELARHWCKHFKKSKAEIEAAIAKVGNNAETVMKELNRNKRYSTRLADNPGRELHEHVPVSMLQDVWP
jgi:Protein of unknown function (DUF3606)